VLAVFAADVVILRFLFHLDAIEQLREQAVTDVTISKRRRRKREIRPEIDRRTSAPFNGETADRTVPDPYSTTGGKIVATASLRDDPLGRLYARRPCQLNS
jgi:hypothetical protein